MKSYISMIQKNRKIIYVFLSILFLFLFVVLSFLIKEDVFNGIDFDLTVRLRDNIPARFDPLLSYFSFFASFEVVGIALAIILVLRRKIWGVVVLFLFFMAHVLELLGKIAIHHPPPPYMFYRRDISFLFPSQYVAEGSSFPSGHSMRVTLIGILALFMIWSITKISKKLKILFTGFIFSFVIFVYVSKVLLGAHWSTDVVGGILIGLSTGFMSILFL